jgi:hypothetical protein
VGLFQAFEFGDVQIAFVAQVPGDTLDASLEAATEMLIRAFGGRFAGPGQPWIRVEDGRPWIDFEAIPDLASRLSAEERRFLLLVASLRGGVQVCLSGVVSGLDRDNLELFLAAAAHAGGSHEHSGIEENPDGTHSIVRRCSLYPWWKLPTQLRLVPPPRKVTPHCVPHVLRAAWP